MTHPRTDVQPVTSHRWRDLLDLFGPSGAYANCWCTWWRLSAREFDDAEPADRRAVLEDLVAHEREPGLLAYRGGVPVGWAAVASRTEYPRLNRSPHTRPVDDVPVWAVTCFWVPRAHRGTGVASALLAAAVRYAASHDAQAVEGYPVDPRVRPRGAAESWTGTVQMFERAGFTEIARRAATGRVVMRRIPGGR